MLFTYYLWIKSVKTGNIYWAALCSVAYFYMVSSWGGYVFLINIIPIHVFVLMCAGRSVSKEHQKCRLKEVTAYFCRSALLLLPTLILMDFLN